MANQIRFKVGYEVDKNGLNEIKNSLQEIQKMTSSDLMSLNKGMDLSTANAELKQIKQTASQVQEALSRSFNSDLGTLNISKFNSELKNLDINRIYNDFNNAGAAGQTAFRNITSQILTTNMQLKQTHNLLDEMATTMSNTIKWGIASSVMNNFTNNVQEAFNYVQKLDSSLNDIRIVTGKSADEMARFAESANKTAKDLSASTRDITEGALIYYQQGDTDEDALAKAEITQKAANVSQISAEDASEYLTAVWNGYQVANEAAQEGIEVYEEYVDKLAAVAAGTASDLEESSIAMSKVASSANAMGVDFDQLNAQIATIISVTRQAPESVGTALKTIYARMGDLAIDGEDEFGTTLGDVSGKMKQMGIDVVDETGNLRDMGVVIEEVAAKWDTWTEAQRQAAAVAMAGKRQYNNLIALFDNWDMYTEALNMSKDALGTLDEQQEIYAERTAAHIQNMKTSFEDLYDSILDEGTINNVVDLIGGAASRMADLVDSVGGGGNALLGLGSIATTVFSKQIAQGIATTITNFQNAKSNAQQLSAELQILQQFKGISNLDNSTQELVNMKQQIIDLRGVVTEEQNNIANSFIQQRKELQDTSLEWENAKKSAEEFYEQITGEKISVEGIKKNSNELKKYQEELERTANNYKNVEKSSSSFSKYLKEATEASAKFDLSENEKDLNSLKNALDKVNDEMDIYVSSVEDIISLGKGNSELTNALSKYTQATKDTIELPREAIVNDTKVQEAAFQLIDAYTRAGKQIRQEAQQTTSTINREVAGTTQQINNGLKSNQEQYNEFIKGIKQQAVIQNFVQIAGAVGQVTFAFQSFLNLFEIWKNEDLSTSEKLLQTFTDISMIVPSVIMAFGTIKTAITGLAVTMGLASAETVTLTGAISSLWAAMGPVGWAIAGIAALGVAIGGIASHISNATKANDEFNQSMMETGKAVAEENQNIANLKSSYESTLQKYKETGEGKEELLNITEQLDDALGLEGTTLTKLSENWDSYNESILRAQKSKAEASRSELESAERSAGEEFSDAMREGTGNINFLTGNYGADFGTATEEQAEIFKKALGDMDSSYSTTTEYGKTFYQSIKLNGSSVEDMYEAYKRVEKAMKDLSDAGYANSDFYKELSSWYDKARDSATAYEEAQQNLIDNQTTLAVVNAQLQNKLTTPTNLEEFKKYREEFANLLKDAQEAGDLDASVDVYELADSYMAEFQTELDTYREELQAIEDLKSKLSGKDVDNFVEGLTEDDLKIIASIEIDDGATVDEVKRAMSIAEAQAKEETSSLGIDAISAAVDSLQETGSLENLDEDQQQYFQEILQTAEGINGLSKASEEWAYISKTGIQEQIEWLTHLQAQEAANATEQVENRRSLIEQELELKQIQQERMEAQLEAAEKEKADFEGQYTEDQLADNVDYQNLINEIDELKQEILDTDSAAQELQNTLEDTDWEFEVDMAGVDEILTVGDSLLSESEKIKEAAMLIGEGFIVAADDAQELADIYPALYENAQVLADGQVQLSAETVQSLLGDEQVLLDGDVQANIARIDGQIALLEAKKASAEAELQLAQAVAQGNVDLTKEQIDIISNGRQQLTNYLMQLGMEEVDANKAVAAAMAGNMDEYNRITAGVADDTANNLAGAMAAAALSAQSNASNMVASIDAIQKQAVLASNAIANMGNGTSTDGGRVAVGGGSAGGTGFTANTRTGNFTGSSATQSTASKPNVSGWINDLQLDISGYTQGIAQLNALKAKLLASQIDTSKALDSAKEGLGGSSPFEDKKGGGGGGGGKGSGSGSEKEEEPEILEQLEDESDLYHDIDLRIKDISKDLDRLQDQQEKLTGKDLIDNLNKQLDILEKQKEAYQDKLEIAKMEADAIKTVLEAQGVTFDEEGTVANYYTAMQAKMNYVNDIISKYNQMSAAEQETYKETVEKAKEDYETFKSLIEQYDDLVSDTIPGIEDDIQDTINEQIEIQIEKFTMEVDLRLDMAEAERDFNEFKRKVIDDLSDDDILGNALAKLADFSSYYKDNGEGVIETLTKQVNDTIDQINQINGGGTSTVYGNNKAQAMEDLKTYYDELISQLEDVEDLVDEINESYLDMIDEAKDKFDEQIDQYEYISDLINHNMSVIGLLYGDDAYGQLSKYYDAQEKNNNKQLDFYRQQVDFWKQRMDAEEEGSEAWEKYKENWEDAVSGLNATVENSVQNLIDKYQNAVNKIFDELNDKLTNNKGLDYINEEWNLINKNADSYLDSVNSMYEIQKLENKYLEAIDNTESLSGQQKLNDLMNEQLEMLKDKEKLTQYDVDRANQMYEIALKEIALQDAQQNKSKMRLRRDAQGNYSYQYVSDEDAIAQAQQELADAQNSLYNLDKDQYKNNLDEIYNVYSEFQQKLLELYQDQTLSEEEREEKKLLLTEQYGELINGLVEQNESIRQNLQQSTFEELARMYDVDVSNFLEMSEAEKDILMNQMIPQWDSGIQDMTDKFAGDGGFISACEDAFKQLEEETKKYEDSLNELESSAGINFDSIAQGYDKNIQLVEDLIMSNDELIDKYNQELNAIQDVINQMDMLISRYQIAKNEAIAATEAAYKYWQQENAMAASEYENQNSGSSSGSGDQGSSGGQGDGGDQGSSGGSSSGSTSGNGVPEVGDVVTYTGGWYYYDSYGTAPAGNRGPGKQVRVAYLNEGAPYPIAVESEDSAYGWLKPEQLEGYDTGGYTGSWNSSNGKIGILHEKELVLNKEDTKNILDSVSLIRNFDNIFNSIEDLVYQKIGNLAKDSYQLALDNFILKENNDKVEQDVRIEANFPNVTDSKQIENAFNNLINVAFQHAHRNKR